MFSNLTRGCTPLQFLAAILKRKDYKSFKCGNYIGLRREDNPELFRQLEKSGFFNFHVTNTRMELVRLHQVVAFVSYGHRAYLNGYFAEKGKVEVHHLDGRTTNNHPQNLWYVSPNQNLLLAQATGDECFSRVLDGCVVPFNRQGKEVKNHAHFMANLVKLTVERTFARLGIVVNVVEILLELPANLGKARVQWAPQFVTRGLRKLGFGREMALEVCRAA